MMSRRDMNKFEFCPLFHWKECNEAVLNIVHNDTMYY